MIVIKVLGESDGSLLDGALAVVSVIEKACDETIANSAAKMAVAVFMNTLCIEGQKMALK